VRVCVFCASSTRIDERYLRLAAAVGTGLARRGHDLVSGGGSVSAMGAVAAAVRAGGRHTVGVIPRAMIPLEVADLDADELVVTAGMRERKAEMDRRAEAFLVLPGGLGTREELFEVWVARTLGLHDKPVVVLDPDGVFGHLHVLVDDLVRRGFARPQARDALRWTTTVPAALAAVEAGGAHLRPSPEEALEATE
jgi:uncharacterized protein (TIGR00730 family)